MRKSLFPSQPEAGAPEEVKMGVTQAGQQHLAAAVQAAAPQVAVGSASVAPSPIPAILSPGALNNQSVSNLAQPPGPNAFEIGVVSYDPDAGLVHIRIKSAPDAEEIDASMKLEDMTGAGNLELRLGESALGPKIVITVQPAVKPPKFDTIEEAEAWMEQHA